jgi:hypothetical protein
MKRFAPLVVALALVLAFAPQAEAQSSPMRLGLKGGAVTSSVGGDYWSVGDWKWGGIAGVLGEYHVARQTYVGLEAYWVQKGGKRVGFSQGSTQDLNLEYIQVPLTIGYVNQFGDWESSLYIGISIAFQISCKIQPTGSSSSTDCDDTSLPSKKTTDWSIPFGFAFMRDLGGSLLGLDIRYDFGLSDVFDNTNVRNRSWQFTLQWAVPMGG